ncbi:MAG: phage integrase N-terminal SAM-like domain-containing protein [Verrucomicrobiales bacterium]|nr:phage integrase N-terminal SAM-like domain-containing protein [Verrucomicrobiales bacterium]
MTTDDLFSAKAAAKAENALPDAAPPKPKVRLQDQVHAVARFQHLSLRTEQAYWEWVVRHLKLHRARAGVWMDPRDLGSTGVTPFLTALAVQGVSVSTQIYTHVMQKPGIGVRSPLDN